jgi:hypothetical protein
MFFLTDVPWLFSSIKTLDEVAAVPALGNRGAPIGVRLSTLSRRKAIDDDDQRNAGYRRRDPAGSA